MKAILLVAGVGARLRLLTDARPKCLLDVGGRSLLARHLDHLEALDAVRGATLVLGYRADDVRRALAGWLAEAPRRLPVDTVFNPDFTLGTTLSVLAAREALEEGGCLLMDADVLYHADVLGRVVASRSQTCLAIDAGGQRTGEEMLACVRGGLAHHLARGWDPSTGAGWELTGEWVGFVGLAATAAARLVHHLDGLVSEGRRDAEYEIGLARLLAESPAAIARVDDLPWTEIDFVDDLRRARTEVLPALTGEGGP